MSAFVANENPVRTPAAIFVLSTVLVLGCNRDDGSYSFDNASAEAQQAIAGNVEFVLDEPTFQKWERAQANLDRLPPGELENAPDPGGSDPVVRGIRRLESSPRARQAIESTGLSVKNFVLATVALAQAVQASRGGVAPTVGAIASNVRFVLARGSRIRNRGAASVWVPPSELSEEELAAMEAMKADTIDRSGEIATGEEGAQSTVPPLQDVPRQQQEPTPLPTDSGRVIPPPTDDSLAVRNF